MTLGRGATMTRGRPENLSIEMAVGFNGSAIHPVCFMQTSLGHVVYAQERLPSHPGPLPLLTQLTWEIEAAMQKFLHEACKPRAQQRFAAWDMCHLLVLSFHLYDNMHELICRCHLNYKGYYTDDDHCCLPSLPITSPQCP